MSANASNTNAPNTTIYIKNLNDKINKDELRAQLYALFLPYGRVLDVIALKTPKMRGQAFVVFSDLVAATTALRAWQGENFYDKPMHIEYAKTKSWATLKVEDPSFVPGIGKTSQVAPSKRPRDGDLVDSRDAKKEKREPELADEEMEMEEDD